jgi:hypothetical protein
MDGNNSLLNSTAESMSNLSLGPRMPDQFLETSRMTGPTYPQPMQHPNIQPAMSLPAHHRAPGTGYVPPDLTAQTPRTAAMSATSSDWSLAFGQFTQHNLSNRSTAYRPATTIPGPFISQQSLHHMAPQFAPTPVFPASSAHTPLYGPTNGGFYDPSEAAAQRPAAEAEFDLEMSRWMESHGDTNSEDVDAILEAMAREQEGARVDPQSLETAATLQPPFHNSTAEADSVFLAGANDQELFGTTGPARESDILDRTTQGLESTALSTEKMLLTSSVDQNSNGRADSGVSEAARQLLESVQHEQGDKWKNSRFLSLMRDFRDGKKDIVDDKICETDAEASTSEGGLPSPPMSDQGTASLTTIPQG